MRSLRDGVNVCAFRCMSNSIRCAFTIAKKAKKAFNFICCLIYIIDFVAVRFYICRRNEENHKIYIFFWCCYLPYLFRIFFIRWMCMFVLLSFSRAIFIVNIFRIFFIHSIRSYKCFFYHFFFAQKKNINVLIVHRSWLCCAYYNQFNISLPLSISLFRSFGMNNKKKKENRQRTHNWIKASTDFYSHCHFYESYVNIFHHFQICVMCRSVSHCVCMSAYWIHAHLTFDCELKFGWTETSCGCGCYMWYLCHTLCVCNCVCARCFHNAGFSHFNMSRAKFYDFL